MARDVEVIASVTLMGAVRDVVGEVLVDRLDLEVLVHHWEQR